jgi:ABC-2 type transport system ATP-binding protein
VGDAAFQQKCFDYFEQLHRDKKTVILVTHDMGAVQRFCNKALFLKDGKVVTIGSPVEIADIYLQENIQIQKNSENVTDETVGDDVSIRLIDDTDEYARIRFEFIGEAQEDLYIGFSLIKNGVVFAEHNNLNSRDKFINNSIDFKFDKQTLNPGVYEVGATIFGVKNKQPIATCHQNGKFIVKGYDETRGGAMKIKDSWEESLSGE